jgi:hypothetical protein
MACGDRSMCDWGLAARRGLGAGLACLFFSFVQGGVCNGAPSGQDERLWPVPRGVSLGVMVGVAIGGSAPSSEVFSAEERASLVSTQSVGQIEKPEVRSGGRRSIRRRRVRSRARGGRFDAVLRRFGLSSRFP